MKTGEKGKKLVVLLGAGAAIPWGGISSNDLRKKFIEDETYIAPNGENIGKYLFDILDLFYKKGNNGKETKMEAKPNFETFIAALEKILLNVLSATNVGGNINNTSFTPAILQLKKEIEEILPKTKRSEKDLETERRVYCYDLFCYFIDLVMDEIEKYNDDVLSNNELNEKLIEFVNNFRKENYSIKFYTTNYDNLVPEILKNSRINVYEGLNKIDNSTFDFDYDLTKFREAPITHFNLHGSIFLRKKINHNTLRYETIYGSSMQKMKGNYALPETGNPNENLIFTPIITGYNKTQRIQNKPFNLGFSAFANDLNECDSLLTVGYSFSDPHINSMLSSFTKKEEMNFVNVTFWNDPKDPYDSSSEANKLKRTFPLLNKKDEDDSWLRYQNDKKHVYKKGFEDFLGDSANWKNL